MDNQKVELKNHKKLGKGLFAKEDIAKDEIIASFDGNVKEAERASDLPNNPPQYFRDHAIQFEKQRWRDSRGFVRYINHSCNPNSGIKNLFDIVTMRDIQAGEELTIDYDMTENSDWVTVCNCGSVNCRKIIKGYRYLREDFREKYKRYISEWLTVNEIDPKP